MRAVPLSRWNVRQVDTDSMIASMTAPVAKHENLRVLLITNPFADRALICIYCCCLLACTFLLSIGPWVGLFPAIIVYQDGLSSASHGMRNFGKVLAGQFFLVGFELDLLCSCPFNGIVTGL